MNIVQRLLLTVLLSAVPIGALQALSVLQERREEQEEVRQIALRTAKRASAEQWRIVEGARQLLAGLAQLPAVREQDAERCGVIAKRLNAQFPLYAAIGVSSPAGRIWCSSIKPGIDVSDRLFFKRAVATHRFTTGGYVVGRHGGGRTLTFSMPLLDPAGTLTGVVVAALDLDRLAADLNRTELPPGSKLLIVGPDARILVNLPFGGHIGERLPQRLAAAFDAPEAGIMEMRWLDGSDRVVGFVPPRSNPAMPFLIAVAADSAVVLARAQDDAWHAGSVLVAVVISALLLAWWFAARYVRQPVQRLTEAARAWRKGDAQFRVGPLGSGSEFDDLGRAFDDMADAVAERERRLGDALESTTDSVLTIDAKWNVTFINARARHRLKGWNVLGRNVWEVFEDVGEEADRAAVRRAMIDRQPVTVTFPYERLGGQFEVNAYPGGDGGLTLFVRDITEQYRAEQGLRRLALCDPLTGLPNRYHALEIARREAREGRLTAMILLDLDGFKHVNDSLGHAAGDEMLRQVSQRFADCLSDEGIVARLGGDEFVILLFARPDERSRALADKLLRRLEREPVVLRGRLHQISFSGGLVLVDHGGAVDIEELLANADIALYRAKALGGGTTCTYTSADRDAYEARRLLEQEVARAAVAGEFELHYQPQVRLADGALVGAEALLRWRHPTRGLIAPASFIDVLEGSREAVRVGTWIIDEACRQASLWARQGRRVRVSVNLFAQQLMSGDLANVVQQALRNHKLPGHTLELELTEKIALAAEQGIGPRLQALRMLGVSLALDDFGTGFASLTTLKDLPIDRLKIDRSFVAQLPHDTNDRGIVEAVLALSRTLNLAVIAEGVENAEQEDYLRARGCQEAQGYHYARPMIAREFQDYLFAPHLRAGTA